MEIVKKYTDSDARIKFFEEPNSMGISESRNVGLVKSIGKYIAVLDSDDVWTDENKLQKQFNFLENNPDYALIGSNVTIVDDKGNFMKNTEYKTEDTDIRKKILISNQMQHSSVLLRKNLAEKAGLYDMKFPVVEDLDLLLKLGLLGKFKNLPEITTAYTRHAGGISYERKLLMAKYHFKTVMKNFGKYPNWFPAMFYAKLRFLKNLF